LAPLREGILRRTLDRAQESRFPLTPQRIVHDVREVMPADGIVALDKGMYKIWFARCYRTRSANTLLLDNALATMGAGLPSAMMAALLYPARRLMAVCVVLIIQDDAYGMIRWKQAVDNFPDWGLTFGNPDFVKYADAYGAKGRRVESAESLAPTLEAAFREGGVQLVIVPVDYSENTRVLVEELKNRVLEVAQ
jgi:acetolactate synthase-1/2/3 large subunit